MIMAHVLHYSYWKAVTNDLHKKRRWFQLAGRQSMSTRWKLLVLFIALSPNKLNGILLYSMMPLGIPHEVRHEKRHSRLWNSYVPYFLSTTTTIPVLISTFGYWNDEYRDMGGLEDVPTFTSFTHEGYRQYASVLNAYLPKERKARIAPVGIAFLLVWEDNYGMWQSLFQPDNFHLSPHGTYLMACVLYYTLYQHMPSPSLALPEAISTLFQRARRMQPPIHPAMPVPTRDEAAYLYHIAKRVMALGHLPHSFVKYTHGEASDYRENTESQDTSYYEEEEEYYFDYQDFEGDDYANDD